MIVLKAEKKALTYIFLYYAATQGLILFVSGPWFDDWCFYIILEPKKRGCKLKPKDANPKPKRGVGVKLFNENKY